MIISYQSIKLETVKENQIEMIRKWRNTSFIQDKMLYKEHISRADQAKWFQKVVAENQLFFVCHLAEEPIGLIYSNNINWDQKISYNSGVFYTKAELYGTGIPLLISLLFTQCSFAFGLLSNEIVIRKDNENAIKFNEAFGFEKTSEKEEYNIYKMNHLSFTLKYNQLPKSLRIETPVSLTWQNTTTDGFLKNIVKQNNLKLEPFFNLTEN